MPTPSNAKSAKSAKPTTSRKPLLYGAVVVLAAGLLGFASYKATSPDDSSRDTAATPAAEVSADPGEGIYPELAKLARRDADDKLAVGRADAPVVLIEYADFKCGYCGKFARDTEPELIEKYVKDGTLRIEWRNFPIFGEESENAARGAWAAGQQDRFWEFHRAAYAEGAKEKGFGKDRVKALAEEAGVKDLDRFMKDLDGKAAREAVAKDQEQAYGIGATSTPSFLINGRPIAGAQPEETFTQAIEAAAEQAKSTAGAGSDRDAGKGSDK
ncbi:thioredoxin domain-containing protein [Streptomyces sp. C11-1]|uniref:Thioredoxin domain-containing protein n=1 Tax=Streptomyces durocortorensis TaxID=2811104 RepID=A0ABY9VX08_9ACTN|nr:thioredoxin domain-containing protein [Streptomyces durocortorensis]WNF28444.1 thioredoxin domain-containing protein [Streptomyces durocortorensis]